MLQAVILTFLVVAGLTLYTFQTKHDFSAMYSGWVENWKYVSEGIVFFSLFAGLLILIVGGLLQIIFQSPVFELVLSLGGAFLFCLFIIVDTQMMMKTLSAEEYILATINLYMDIVNLFLYILRILQELNRQ